MHGDHASRETDLASSVPTESKKMIRFTTRTSIILLICAVLGTGILLVIPIPDARHHRIVTGMLNLGHIPLFAVVAFIAFTVLGRNLWTVAALVALVTGGELIQGLAPGRTPDIDDLVHGLLGVGITWVWTGKSRWSRFPRRELATVALMLLPIYQIGPGLLDVGLGLWQFPMLCDFTTPGQERRWIPNGVRIREVQWPDGTTVGRLAFRPNRWEYPGSEFIPVLCDWRGYSALEIEIESSELIPLLLTVRDQRPEQSYDGRFNLSYHYPPGKHVIRLPLEAIRTAPKDAPLDLSRMDSVNFFIEQKDTPRTMIIRQIRLVK